MGEEVTTTVSNLNYLNYIAFHAMGGGVINNNLKINLQKQNKSITFTKNLKTIYYEQQRKQKNN